jgi:hypothetical protein
MLIHHHTYESSGRRIERIGKLYQYVQAWGASSALNTGNKTLAYSNTVRKLLLRKPGLRS